MVGSYVYYLTVESHTQEIHMARPYKLPDASFTPYPEEPREYHVQKAQDVYRTRLDIIRQQPGVWFVLGEWSKAGNAYAYRNEAGKRHPDFEFTARSFPDGKGKVYARYIGDDIPNPDDLV